MGVSSASETLIISMRFLIKNWRDFWRRSGACPFRASSTSASIKSGKLSAARARPLRNTACNSASVSLASTTASAALLGRPAPVRFPPCVASCFTYILYHRGVDKSSIVWYTRCTWGQFSNLSHVLSL